VGLHARFFQAILCQRSIFSQPFVCDSQITLLEPDFRHKIFKSCRGNKKFVHAVPNAIFPLNCVYVHVITADGMIKRRMASGHYHNCKIDMLFNFMLQRVTFFLNLISNELHLLRNDLQEN
jgi:hypothetical protein